MTGLEQIIAGIRADAQAEADQTAEAAAEAAARTLAQAKAEAETQAQAILAAGRLQAEDILKSAESAASLTRRKALLTARQKEIAATITAAHAELLALPDADYEALLLRLAEQQIGAAQGEMHLCEKDLARLSGAFEEKLAKAAPGAVLNRTPVKIDGGFILVSGSIEQNCSFASMFAAAHDRLADLAFAGLFDR